VLTKKNRHTFKDNEDGFGSTELLISVFFLLIMVFFSYQMLKRQEQTVIFANQNVEATTIIFQMRSLLVGAGCSENFSGMNRQSAEDEIKSLKKTIIYDDGTFEVKETFPVESYGVQDFSKTGLSVESYSLDPKAVNRSKRGDRVYLYVRFKRGEEREYLVKTITIYIQHKLGIIENCSLSPFARSLGKWTNFGKELIYKRGNVGIKTNNIKAALNIKGSLYVEKKLNTCDSSHRGIFGYDPRKKVWTICGPGGNLPLFDKRKLP